MQTEGNKAGVAAELKENPLACSVMKNEIPKEIVLIHMHGLNLLPVAKGRLVCDQSHARRSRAPSGATLIRVTEGHVVTRSLK